MRYVCFVHVDQSLIDAATPEELANMDGDNQRANAELTASGHLVLDLALKAPDTARLVRSRGGKVSATDGPYVESKEHLGGFFVIEARNLDEATDGPLRHNRGAGRNGPRLAATQTGVAPPLGERSSTESVGNWLTIADDFP